jgi:hypothetical protein
MSDATGTVETSTVAEAALREAAAAIGAMTAEQLADLAAGRARLVLVPVEPAGPDPALARASAPPTAPAPRRPVTTAADPDVVGSAVRAIQDLHTPGEVAEHLHRHRYPVPVLRQVARALGPTVSTAARNRAGLERDIVEGTAGYRARSAAMSGGAWS